MIQVPSHPQLYPSNLIKHRIEEFVYDDGRPPTWNRKAAAKYVTGKEALAMVVATQARLATLPPSPIPNKGPVISTIDPRYYVATLFHESGCKNEWDTEIASPTCLQGFVSVGAYQIGYEEAHHYGFTLLEMLDFGKATECMIRMAEDHRRNIRFFAGLKDGDPDPDYVVEYASGVSPTWSPIYLATDESKAPTVGEFVAAHPDKSEDVPGPNGAQLHRLTWIAGTMRAYLALAHNQGLGAAHLTIMKYKMNWTGYQQRNHAPIQHCGLVDHHYGHDCVWGGPYYPFGA